MKRLRRTIHTSHHKKTPIDREIGRQQRQKEAMGHWTSLSIDNSQINQNAHRPLAVSTGRMAFAAALKRSHFYRKVISQSTNTHHQADNHFQISHEDVRHSQEKPKIQQTKHSIVHDSSSNRHPQHDNKEKEGRKLKSFESFLESRRKQNQKTIALPLKRTRIIKNMLIEAQTSAKAKDDELNLNLLGKAIRKLKDADKSSKSQNNQGGLEALWRTHQFMSSDDETVQTPVKLRSIQSEWQRSKPPGIKYIFRDDQGYCFFDKIINPLSPHPKSIQTHKKCLYYTMHRDARKAQQANKSVSTTPVGNNIEGWIINTEEEDEF